MKQICPFCPLMGIESEQYESVGNDFYGEPAMVGNVRSCAACATVAQVTDTVSDLLDDLSNMANRNSEGK